MTFGSPWFLLGLLIAIPVVIAFLMRRRRSVLRVPSTLLWRGASLKRIRNRKIRNLTRLLALLACALGVAALAFAATLPRRDDPGETLAVVVDVSASMGRGEGRGTPLAQATRYLSNLLLSRDPEDRVVIIAAGERPRRLAGPTRNGALLDDAVEAIVPERGGSDLGAAVDLAAGMIEGQPNPRLVVLRDGGVPSGDPPRSLARAEIGNVQERLFTPRGLVDGAPQHNVGIVTFATRRPNDAESNDERELLVGVATSSPQSRRVKISIEAFGAPLAERRLEVPAEGEAELRLRVRTPAEVLTARVSADDHLPDELGADDAVSLAQGAVVPPRVLLVVEEDAPEVETFFVTQALTAAGVAEVVRVTPERAHEEASPQDVVVALGSPPQRRPAAPMLMLGTRGAGGDFPLTGQRELVASAGGAEGDPTRLHSVAEHHPLMLGVDLNGVTIHHALAVDEPEGSRALVELDGGPVVLTGGDGADGWVYIGLDATRSDLVLRVAFPVLISNALALLGGATQVSVAQTVPRAEVELREGDRIATETAPEMAMVVPHAPSLWLAVLAALLLGAEAFAWRKGWTR